MQAKALGSKVFLQEDQVRFGKLSGDINPMHMDAIAARRTQAGAPVVHGVHNALLAFEYAAPHLSGRTPISSVKAIFNKMVYLGEAVEYHITGQSETRLSIEGFVEGTSTVLVVITSGGATAPAFTLEPVGNPIVLPEYAAELTLEHMDGLSGCLGLPASPAEVCDAFPACCALWSPERIRALIATTTLVGMVCPGRHSIFAGLTLHATEEAAPPATLAYRVTSADPRFRKVAMQVQGGRTKGTINCFARVPPVAQPSLLDLAGLSQPGEFAGATALVVGGSRGLGELTAKLLVLGGAKVIVTYASGKTDAEALMESIRAWGGSCDILQYDVRNPADGQLAALAQPVTHLYYFATPPIFRRKTGLFAAARYAEFHAFYVTGFYELFVRLHADSPHGLVAFYPSSVSIDDRPKDMTEYTMAKSAGEILCADMSAWLPGASVTVSRLPRLATDQTTSVMPGAMQNAVDIMLPLIRRVQKPVTHAGERPHA